jgi:hypothetical protein
MATAAVIQALLNKLQQGKVTATVARVQVQAWLRS